MKQNNMREHAGEPKRRKKGHGKTAKPASLKRAHPDFGLLEHDAVEASTPDRLTASTQEDIDHPAPTKKKSTVPKKPANSKRSGDLKPAKSPNDAITTNEVREDQQFAQLNCLSNKLLISLQHNLYLRPTPIQQALIPIACKQQDCIGQARTGTGKTAAFVIPILEHLVKTRKSTAVLPVALILSPTRELAEQVAAESRKIGQLLPYRSIGLVGGRSVHQQKVQLHEGGEIIVGTPGRVIDHIRQGTLRLHDLEYVVLDEADRMLDIGFLPDIKRILKACPESRQTMLLSATLPKQIEELARQFMKDPVRIDLSGTSVTVEQIEQFYLTVDNDRKFRLLVHLLKEERPQQVIVFCRTKVRAHDLYTKFSGRISMVEAIHGDLQQNKRDRAIRKFREGEVRLLIATDIVGRGIDVSGVSHIINYDVPEDCDDYVHRVGRTGRMSSKSSGRAITLVTREEGNQLTRIEMRINRMLNEYPKPNFELTGPSRKNKR